MVDVLLDFFVLFFIGGEFGEVLEEFRQEALGIISWESSLDHPLCVDILHFKVSGNKFRIIFLFLIGTSRYCPTNSCIFSK